jgi:hypothetical protein
VLRFWNNEVLNNTDGVLEVIVEHLGRPSAAPSPVTPLRGGPPSPAKRSSAAPGGEGKKDRA